MYMASPSPSVLARGCIYICIGVLWLLAFAAVAAERARLGSGESSGPSQFLELARAAHMGGDREDVYGFAVAERARQGVHIHLHWGCQGCLLCRAAQPLERARLGSGGSSGPSQFLGRDSFLERDFNVSAWAYGIAEQETYACIADRDRWCVLCLEVAEEPNSSRRSPAYRGGAQPYRVRWGYGLGRGRKISKTLGNGIDPIDTMKEYGMRCLCGFHCLSGTFGQLQESLAPRAANPNNDWHDYKLNHARCKVSQIQFLQGFRDQMLDAIKGVSKSNKNGLFINSCFAHCQSERQDMWFTDDSPTIRD
ncbi:hypothetical protein Syun_031669 [Stephania yunnanensis]|uniref:Pectin acetylesterase n=1 Tax=Stephania yunnanensis TaxID=152371 RepID=A0AAP0DV42_9MAGN